MLSETEILKAYEEKTTPLGWLLALAAVSVVAFVISRGFY